IRHLAKANASSIAVIGTGVQGYYQAEAACSERSIQDIYLFNHTMEKIPSFKTKLANHLNSDVNIHICHSAENAIRHVEIIITVTKLHHSVFSINSSLLKRKLIIWICSFQSFML